MSFVLIAGCSSAPRPVHERAWIGGEFDRDPVAVPASGDSSQGQAWREGVLVANVYDGTPLANAGVTAGDVVLRVDGAPIECASELHEAVANVQPGESILVDFYHPAGDRLGGEERSATVVSGVEKYERLGTLKLGLGLSGSLDLFPNPDFNIFGLLSYRSSDKRPQFEAPRARLRRAVGSATPRLRAESWDFWCLIFGVGKQVEIVEQKTRAGAVSALAGALPSS